MRIRVSGMTCPNCERAVEKALSAVPGVASSRASFSSGWVEITPLSACDQVPSRASLEEAIRQAGYQPVPAEAKAADMGTAARSMGFLGLTVLAFWLLGQAVPGQWTAYFPDPGTASSLWALFCVGLLTSLHCLAMCGGIAMSQGLAAARDARTSWPAVLSYQLGRLLSYGIVGAIVGSLGQALTLSPAARGAIMLAAGVFMVLMALNMLGGFAFLRRLQPRPPRWLVDKCHFLVRRNASVPSQNGGLHTLKPLLVGLANGLMPCGPLQSMQLYALGTVSAWAGALAMSAFCLGTLPAMLGLGFVTGRLGQRGKGRLFQAAALLVMLLGLGMLHNGLALSGQMPSLAEAVGVRAQRTSAGQVVTSLADYDAYEPIVVQRGLPVTWTLLVPEEKLIGCNNEILAPELGIAQKLVAGENRISFTPSKTGIFSFSCWMGMIRSHITVVDEL